MTRIGQNDGISIIEILIVTGIIALIVTFAASMASQHMTSRSLDSMMKNMSSTLQMAKMKAARHGVEYRAVFARCTAIVKVDPGCPADNPGCCPVCTTYVDFAPGDETMTMSIERGNSNRGSSKWCIESTVTKKIHSHLDLDMTAITENDPYRCGFNPNGFVVDANGTPVTAPIPMSITPNSFAKVNRCGSVEVKPIGGVTVLRGNWDGTTCNPISEP